MSIEWLAGLIEKVKNLLIMSEIADMNRSPKICISHTDKHIWLEVGEGTNIESCNHLSIYQYGVRVSKVECDKLIKYKQGKGKYCFPVDHDGCYLVEIELKTGEKISSNLLLVDTDEFGFSSLCRKREVQKKMLPLMKGNRIYKDWLLTSKRIDSEFYGYFEDVFDLMVGGYYFYGQTPLIRTESNAKQYISGFVENHNGIEIGETLEGKDYLENDGLGRYSRIKFDGKSIIVDNDYFGLEKIFLMQIQGTNIISNRLHLLLEAARALGIPLSLDETVVEAMLSSNIWLFAQQSFTTKTCIQNVSVAPIEKLIFINPEGKILLKDKDIAKILKSNDGNELINKAAIRNAVTDIKNRTCNTYSKSVDQVKITDVTSGLDSRMVLSVLPINEILSSGGSPISFRTLKIDGDWEYAKKIAAYFGLRFIKCDNRPLSPFDVYRQKRSWLMGKYFKFNYIKGEIKSWDSIHLNFTGGGGEAMTRPYVRQYVGLVQAIAISKLATEIQSDALIDALKGRFPGFITDNVAPLIKVISEELLRIPGDSFLGKLEYLYLAYRTPYHFNTFTSNYNVLTLMPLLSKPLYSIFYPLSKKSNLYNLAFDVVNDGNAILNCFGYDKEEYMDELSSRFPAICKNIFSRSVNDSDVEYNDFTNKTLKIFAIDDNFDLADDFESCLVLIARHGDRLYEVAKSIFIWYKGCKNITKNNMVYMHSRVRYVADLLGYVS